MRKIRVPILVASLYLLAYQVLPFVNAKPVLIAAMFGIAPFIVVWMVISILRKGVYNGKKLNDEFGYEDYDPHIGV